MQNILHIGKINCLVPTFYILPYLQIIIRRLYNSNAIEINVSTGVLCVDNCYLPQQFLDVEKCSATAFGSPGLINSYNPYPLPRSIRGTCFISGRGYCSSCFFLSQPKTLIPSTDRRNRPRSCGSASIFAVE